jgi:hypothetical protein
MTNDIPIQCTLTDDEFRERERNVISRLIPSVVERVETPDGYSFRFPSADGFLADLHEFILLERKCCPFLDFKLSVGRGGGDVMLELSGPPGAKEFIASTFVTQVLLERGIYGI